MARFNVSHIGSRLGAAVLVALVVALDGVTPALATARPRAQSTASSVTVTCGLANSNEPRVLSANVPCTVVTGIRETFKIALPTGFRWGAVDSTSHVVKVAISARPAAGGLRASVTGLRTGITTLHSAGGMVCPPGVACPALARLWSLVVLVNVAASAAVAVPISTNDNGRQFTLRRGDRLNVKLVGPSSYEWTKAVASSGAVLKRVSVIWGDSVGGAVFVASGAGRSTVTAVDNPRCYPQCLSPSRLFRVLVTVAK